MPLLSNAKAKNSKRTKGNSKERNFGKKPQEKVSPRGAAAYSSVRNKRAGTFINFQVFFQGACFYFAQDLLVMLIFLTKPT